MNIRWHVTRGFLGGLAVAIVGTLLTARSWAEDPAKAPAAAAPAAAAEAAEPAAEPEPPVMQREFQELREFKNADGIMMPIEENRKARTEMTGILQAGKFETPDKQALFDDYYRFRIAELTWTENLTQLPQKRERLKRDLGSCGKAPEPLVHEQLNAKLLSVLQNIALKDVYHPVVRHNCMLLIGSLDLVEPTFNKAGTPLPAALPVLELAVGDVNQPDAVRVAAMFGIVRHCDFEIAQGERAKLVALLAGIVRTKQPAGAGTAVGLGWLRHRAAQALGRLAARAPEANKPEVAAALEQLIGDSEAMLLARADAAHSFGSLEKSSYGGRTPSSAGALLGQLAIDIVVKGPVPEAGKLNSESLTYCLLQTVSALKNGETNRGIAAAATDQAAKKFVKDLADKIDGLIATANDRNLDDDSRISRLKDDGDRLDQWLKKSGVSLAKTN